jgi:hypothetical protein
MHQRIRRGEQCGKFRAVAAIGNHGHVLRHLPVFPTAEQQQVLVRTQATECGEQDRDVLLA